VFDILDNVREYVDIVPLDANYYCSATKQMFKPCNVSYLKEENVFD